MSLDKEKLKEYIQKNPNILLDDLANKIGEGYWVKKEIITDFLKGETKENLKQFKENFHKKEVSSEASWEKISEKKLDENLLEELYYTIEWAKQVLKELSQKDRENLKAEIPASASKSRDYVTAKILPNSMILRIQNPKNLGDQIAGLCIGTINSSEEIVKTLYEIGVWIIKAPKDIYLIASGQGEYKRWKDV